jgi:hypothetical protein
MNIRLHVAHLICAACDEYSIPFCFSSIRTILWTFDSIKRIIYSHQLMNFRLHVAHQRFAPRVEHSSPYFSLTVCTRWWKFDSISLINYSNQLINLQIHGLSWIRTSCWIFDYIQLIIDMHQLMKSREHIAHQQFKSGENFRFHVAYHWFTPWEENSTP